MPDTRTREAIALMNAYAERTGLSSDQSRRRYLWTDAFAVCNYLGLARITGDEGYTRLALQLVEQVHHTLGRHRDDDTRQAWISGLDEADGERHPTRGGLRIGKPLPERGPDDSLDERLEWDRDGQYFHYLTRWMHALDQVTRALQQPRYNTWGRELARSAFDAFTYPPAYKHGPRSMAWKMSIDLTRVLVPSMGQHDPHDGYITALQLHTTAAALAGQTTGPNLDDVIGDYAAMIRRSEWATPDPLGLGGLLVDAWRVQQLIQQGAQPDVSLLERLLDDAATGLHYYARSDDLRQPAGYRLAFRELGLAIGQTHEDHRAPPTRDPRAGPDVALELRVGRSTLGTGENHRTASYSKTVVDSNRPGKKSASRAPRMHTSPPSGTRSRWHRPRPGRSGPGSPWRSARGPIARRPRIRPREP